MTSLTMFFTIILLLPISTTLAGFYQEVEGKCKNLPTIKSYDARKMATGEWFYHYVSFGQDGDKCATGHSVARGDSNYADLLVFDSKTNKYLNLPLDLTYHTDQPGIYTHDATGAVGHVIAIDISDNIFYVQCLEEEGKKSQVVALLATRAPVMDDEAQQVYDDFTKTLKELNLLPEMHTVPQTECPPIKDVTYA